MKTLRRVAEKENHNETTELLASFVSDVFIGSAVRQSVGRAVRFNDQC